VRKNIFLIACLGSVLLSTAIARAGFQEDFNRSVSPARQYRKDFKDTETADLIVNTSSVLHKENLEILRVLEELKREVSELKKAVDRLKAEAESAK